MWECGNAFPRVIQKYEKFVNLHHYIFDIFQYFKTKLHNFTEFRKLFPTLLKLFSNLKVCLIDVRSPYITPELNNELQCNVGNMWEKITMYLYALKPRDVSTSKVHWGMV